MNRLRARAEGRFLETIQNAFRNAIGAAKEAGRFENLHLVGAHAVKAVLDASATTEVTTDQDKANKVYLAYFDFAHSGFTPKKRGKDIVEEPFCDQLTFTSKERDGRCTLEVVDQAKDSDCSRSG